MTLGTDSPPQVTERWSKIAPLFGLLFVLFVVASVFVAERAGLQRLARFDPPLLPDSQEPSRDIGVPDPSSCRIRSDLVQLPSQLATAARR